MSRGPRRTLRASKSRYYVTMGRGDRIRCLALRPWALYAFLLGTPLIIGAGAVGVANLAFPSESVATLSAQQTEMRVDYEDRLAAMRAKIDQIVDKGARQHDVLEAKLRILADREAALDKRSEEIAQLAGRPISAAGKTIVSSADAQPQGSAPDDGAPLIDPLLESPGRSSSSPPGSTQAFAPPPSGLALGAQTDKPHPDGVEIRSDRDKTSALIPNPVDDPALPISARLSAMNADLTGVEASQLRAVARIAASDEKSAEKIRTAMEATGLSLRRLSAGRTPSGSQADVGGPFVPVKFDDSDSPFESRLAQLQTEITESHRLVQALPYLPFRQPLAGPLVTTSPFGIRVDPFFGRMAMHTGNDFRGPFGARVMATAAGKVDFASFDGGYGNMVEIDHGNGLTTRYAHLSAITVVKGQEVQAGQEVGRLGSTGRSTGPHLHYEVRIDGRPVDPIPFVKAGERLFAAK